jgi:hypothetical protein
MEESLNDSDQVVADDSNLPWFQDPARSKPFTLFKTVDVRTDFSNLLIVT